MKTLSRSRRRSLQLIFLVVVVKILFFVFAFHSYQVLANKPLADFAAFLDIFVHWDSRAYLQIAENGYESTGENRVFLVYFPLYPLLIAAVNMIVGSYVLSSLIVTTVSTFALVMVFHSLVRLDHSERTAWNASVFLLIFPTSYFLHVAYTESLFLALAIGCFLAVRKEKWLLAGLLGLLASQSRINGMFLLPALLFEVWAQYKRDGKVNFNWGYLLLIPLGTFSYLLLNYSVSGDPLKFMEYQQTNWQKYLRLPFDGLWAKYRAIFDAAPVESNIVGFQELLFVLIGLAAIVLGWKYLRSSYRVWMILNWLLFVSTSFILSVPRYTLLLFPIFILMAISAGRSRSLNVAYLVWSLLYLGLFTGLFVRGHWAF